VPFLVNLNLGDNQLTDVKGLEKLTQLRFLGLRDNQLTDVKARDEGRPSRSFTGRPDY
jgi:Leucine-rich repeat (LRR) protein